VTTLLDAEAHPVDALAELYRQRWGVETNLSPLKATLGMDELHCKSGPGVLKEVAAFAVVHNLVRLVVPEASRRQGRPVGRISFIGALRWITCSPPDASLPDLVVNPERSGRVEPRRRKHRAKDHAYMIRPRAELKKHLQSQGVPT
jgi:hypothetical protein